MEKRKPQMKFYTAQTSWNNIKELTYERSRDRTSALTKDEVYAIMDTMSEIVKNEILACKCVGIFNTLVFKPCWFPKRKKPASGTRFKEMEEIPSQVVMVANINCRFRSVVRERYNREFSIPDNIETKEEAHKYFEEMYVKRYKEEKRLAENELIKFKNRVLRETVPKRRWGRAKKQKN